MQSIRWFRRPCITQNFTSIWTLSLLIQPGNSLVKFVLERPERAAIHRLGKIFNIFFFFKWNNENSGNQGLLNRKRCASFLKWLVGMYVMYFTLLTPPAPETILIVEIIQMQWFSQGLAAIRITCNYYWGSGTNQFTGQGDWGWECDSSLVHPHLLPRYLKHGDRPRHLFSLLIMKM